MKGQITTALARTLIAGLITVFTNTAQAQDLDCSKPEDLPQQGMNMCAFLDWQKADEELNALWPEVRNRMKDIDHGTRDFYPDRANGEENLLKAQRAWINFRDGHCEAEGATYTGGSIQPLIIHSCRAHLTRVRIKQLQELLTEY